jgi:drug/metabolite transporter (DMT)-like permease
VTERVLQLAVVAGAGLAVAAADVLIKRAGSSAPNLAGAVVQPLTAVALGLYVVQIVLFAYAFVRRWELGIVALLQTVFYAAACVLIGRFFFDERVTGVQMVGMLLALIGALLMNGGVVW